MRRICRIGVSQPKSRLQRGKEDHCSTNLPDSHRKTWAFKYLCQVAKLPEKVLKELKIGTFHFLCSSHLQVMASGNVNRFQSLGSAATPPHLRQTRAAWARSGLRRWLNTCWSSSLGNLWGAREVKSRRRGFERSIKYF